MAISNPLRVIAGAAIKHTAATGRSAKLALQRPHLDRQVGLDLGVARVFGGYTERRSRWARQVGVQAMLAPTLAT